MNRVFYIFRHGETDWNRERRCQGHTDTPLNEMGLLQARELAEKLTEIPLDVIITSDLVRAHETGRSVALKKSIPILVDSRLREMSYGKAEGMLFNDAINSFGPELWTKLQSFKSENDEVGFPDGETRKFARERFLSAIQHLIETTDYINFGISTHGGAIRNVIHHFLPDDLPMLSIPNCVVYKLIYDATKKQFIADAEPLKFKNY